MRPPEMQAPGRRQAAPQPKEAIGWTAPSVSTIAPHASARQATRVAFGFNSRLPFAAPSPFGWSRDAVIVTRLALEHGVDRDPIHRALTREELGKGRGACRWPVDWSSPGTAGGWMPSRPRRNPNESQLHVAA